MAKRGKTQGEPRKGKKDHRGRIDDKLRKSEKQRSRQGAASRRTDGRKTRPQGRGGGMAGSASRHQLKAPRWLLQSSVLGVLIILAAVTVVYSSSLGNDFVYDDRYLILQNEVVNNPDNIAKAFEVRFYTGLNYYRPLPLITFALEHRLWGVNPFGYHLTNLILLLGVALALYFLLLRLMGGRRWLACLLALCFGLHPAVSSVGMALGARGDLLCMLFLLSAFIAYLHRSTASYVGALLLFVLALFSKETAVTFPIVLLLADLLRVTSAEDAPRTGGKSETGRAPGLGKVALRHSPFWAVLAGYVIVRWAVLPGLASEAALDPALTVKSYLYLLQTSLIPTVNLVYEPLLEDWFSWQRLGLMIALVGVIAALIFIGDRSRHRAIAFWLAWAGITFLPTSNIVGQETTFDERYTVLPLIGMVAGIGLAVYYAGRKARSHLSVKLIFCLALIIPFAVITLGRGKTWSDDVSFCAQWQKGSRANPRPRHHLGIVFWDRDRMDLARNLFTEAVNLDPEYVPSLNMLGLSSHMQGRYDEAITYLERAVKLDPNYSAAQYNLAGAYDAKGEPASALPHYEAAAALDPPWLEALFGIAQSNHKLRRWEEAVIYYRRVLRLNPDVAEAYFGLSGVYEEMGLPSQAMGLIRQGLKYAPADTAASRRLERLMSESPPQRAGPE